ncbi:MAG: lipid-A-disaccharide synthase [Verrucomicrobiota bacterium]
MPKPITLPRPSQRPDLLIIAGEHSGDHHAAAMLKDALLERPDMQVCALGGDALKRSGAQVIFDLVDHSVVGFAEVLKHYGFFKQLFASVVGWIAEHRPRAVCFVDYPGFNLRLAERLVKDGLARKGGGEIALLYYISPQIWAWKGHRRFKMAKLLDALSVIFPFEVACYEDTDLPTEFVGHPFVAGGYQLSLAHNPTGPVLLLPGSRIAPVQRIFPVLVESFLAYRAGDPDRRAIALYPSASVKQQLQTILAEVSGAAEVIDLQPAETPVEASAVLTSSGTMSLQVALAGIPGCIVYRAHWWTYFLGKNLVKIPYLGIANILLDRPAYPEFIQAAAEPGRLQTELQRLLADDSAATTAAANTQELRTLLGEGSQNSAATWLLAQMDSRLM